MVKRSSLKNVTLSADSSLIDEARRLAGENNATLNELFRSWLEQFVRPATTAREYETLMNSMKHVKPGRRFSRDEMNER